MGFDFKSNSAVDERLTYFEDSEVLRRVPSSEAKSLAPKAKDCQKQLYDATSVWAIDGRKFLFVFTELNEEGRQKVTVWGLKGTGDYQRVKTVWVSNHDYIFEAVAIFLTEYFELALRPESYDIDVDWYYDIEDELDFLVKANPPYLKPKMKLLKVWNEVMPRYNRAVSDLDFKVLRATEPDMHDIVAPHETSDPLKMLESLHRLNPEGFKDFIKKIVSPEDESARKARLAKVDLPSSIEKVAEKWEKNEVKDNSPLVLIDAYIRFERAWNSYRACVAADMFGNICTEYWNRTDRLACLIDRKLHKTTDLNQSAHLMNLYRLLMPQFIDMPDDEDEKNFKYEKSWNKRLAEKIVKVGDLNHDSVELLIRVREDFKRLPSPISKFIKTDVPAFLYKELNKINKDSIRQLPSLKNAIRTLDSFIQWNLIMENDRIGINRTADQYVDMIIEAMEKVEDIEAWGLYCNLLMTGFAPYGTKSDRQRLMNRVETRLRKLLLNNRNGESKTTLADELLLAAMYLENVFLEDQGCDIYTSYWALYQQNKIEEESWKANGKSYF